MYKASPKNKTVLDLRKAKKFISTIDFKKVNAMGFYGGEISCDYETYQKVIDLIPKKVIKFTITNGSWLEDCKKCNKFLNFVKKNKLQAFISTTKFHQPFQNKKLLKEFAKRYNFQLKRDDEIIPMGRARKNIWKCSKKCMRYACPMRLTLNPYGKIMFCNCDGVYPIVGTYKDNFIDVVERGKRIENYCNKLKKRKGRTSQCEFPKEFKQQCPKTSDAEASC